MLQNTDFSTMPVKQLTNAEAILKYDQQEHRTDQDERQEIPQIDPTCYLGDNGVFYPQKNDFFLAVPSSIDLDGVLERAKNKGLHDYKVVKLLAIISANTVSKRVNRDDGKWEFYSKSFTQIKSARTKKICNNFKEIYTFLKEEKILIRSPYKHGEYSFSYGFSFPLRFQRLKIHKFSHNKLTQSIRPKYKDNHTQESCKILVKPFKRQLFGIDYHMAEKKLYEKYCGDISQNPFGGFVLDDDKNSMLSYGAYHQAINQLINLLNGRFYFSRSLGNAEEILSRQKEKLQRNRLLKHKQSGVNSVSNPIENTPKNDLKITKASYRDQTKKQRQKFVKRPVSNSRGRFYTTFSFLNKETRSLLHYDGEELVQIDVRNCVAFLLANYLRLGAFKFTESMLNYISSNQSYVFYSYKLCREILAETGIDLRMDYPRNILKPMNQLEVVRPVSNDGKIPDQDLSSILFQKVSGSEPVNLSNILPSNNLLKDSSSINPLQLPTAVNPTERLVSSNTSNLGLTVTSASSYCSVRLQRSFQPVVTPDDNNKVTRKNNEKSLAYDLFSYYRIPEFFETALNRELEEFLELAKGGEFYEFFIGDFKKIFTGSEWADLYKERMSKTYCKTATEDRALTKHMLTAMIYASNGSSDYKQVKWAFVKKFPLVYALIRDLKGGRYKLFANELFKLEAELIIDKVAKGLIKQQIPCLTVHDCIAVKKSHMQTAMDMIEKSFIEKLGNCPKIDIEDGL